MSIIQNFVLSLVVLFTAQAYSGMEQTEKCNKEIETLKSKISSIEKEIKDSKRVRLIPIIIKGPKIRGLEKKKEIIQKELDEEEGKLQFYKSIIIRKIEIHAKGSWEWSDPDLTVKMGIDVIGQGDDDKRDLYLYISKDATSNDYLTVYDRETMGKLKEMGEISLEKDTLPKGVSGDSLDKRIEGEIKKDESKSFSYIIEYTVEY